MSNAIAKFHEFASASQESDECSMKQYMRIKHHLYSAKWKYCHEWKSDSQEDDDLLKLEQDLTGEQKWVFAYIQINGLPH